MSPRRSLFCIPQISHSIGSAHVWYGLACMVTGSVSLTFGALSRSKQGGGVRAERPAPGGRDWTREEGWPDTQEAGADRRHHGQAGPCLQSPAPGSDSPKSCTFQSLQRPEGVQMTSRTRDLADTILFQRGSHKRGCQYRGVTKRAVCRLEASGGSRLSRQDGQRGLPT